MVGILAKAIRGGAGALKESSFAMIQAEIMKLRDKRLNEYASQRDVAQHERTVALEKDVRQPFEREQTTRQIGSRERIAKETRGLQERLANLEGQDLQNQIAKIELENAQAVKELRAKYGQAQTEEERSRIAENLSILTGKDTANFLPVPLKDELGNITGYDIFDKRRGKFVAKSNNDAGAGNGAGAAGEIKASYKGPNGRVVSREQIETTAKNRGMSAQQVIEQLGLK